MDEDNAPKISEKHGCYIFNRVILGEEASCLRHLFKRNYSKRGE